MDARHNNRPLTDEQRTLAGDPKHVKLATDIADHAARQWPTFDRDTLRAEAFYGLVCAARNYRPQEGVQFQSFAAHHIRGAILEYVRTTAKHGFTICRQHMDRLPGIVSTEQRMQESAQDSRPVTVGDTLDSGEMPVGWEMESHESVSVITARLPPRYTVALRLYLLHAQFNLRMRDVSEVMRTSESRISQMLCDGPLMLAGKVPSEVPVEEKPTFAGNRARSRARRKVAPPTE